MNFDLIDDNILCIILSNLKLSDLLATREVSFQCMRCANHLLRCKKRISLAFNSDLATVSTNEALVLNELIINKIDYEWSEYSEDYMFETKLNQTTLKRLSLKQIFQQLISVTRIRYYFNGAVDLNLIEWISRFFANLDECRIEINCDLSTFKAMSGKTFFKRVTHLKFGDKCDFNSDTVSLSVLYQTNIREIAFSSESAVKSYFDIFQNLPQNLDSLWCGSHVSIVSDRDLYFVVTKYRSRLRKLSIILYETEYNSFIVELICDQLSQLTQLKLVCASNIIQKLFDSISKLQLLKTLVIESPYIYNRLYNRYILNIDKIDSINWPSFEKLEFNGSNIVISPNTYASIEKRFTHLKTLNMYAFSIGCDCGKTINRNSKTKCFLCYKRFVEMKKLTSSGKMFIKTRVNVSLQSKCYN